MDGHSIYISKSFLRTFTLAGAWTIMGAGIFMFFGEPSMAAAFLIFVGIGVGYLAFRRKSLKDGDYPRSRLAVMIASGIGMLLLGLFLAVFAKGSLIFVWAVYFIGIAALLAVSAIQFARSSRPEMT